MFAPMYFHSLFGTCGGVVAKGGTATSASTWTRLRAFIIEARSEKYRNLPPTYRGFQIRMDQNLLKIKFWVFYWVTFDEFRTFFE